MLKLRMRHNSMRPRHPVAICALIALIAIVSRPDSLRASEADATAEPQSETLAWSNVDGIDPSLAKDARRSIRIALGWLDTKQSEEGHWSVAEHPAITALVVCGYCGDPNRAAETKLPEAALTGLAFIQRCAQPDGSIWVNSEHGGGLRHYNTSLCLTALCATMDPAYTTAVERARSALVSDQHIGSDVYSGGYGYDAGSGREYADLSNTVIALEAIHMAESYLSMPDVTPATPAATLDWDAAIRFLERVQNRPESNDQTWAQNADADDEGGFVYHPEASKAGETSLPDGGRQLRSYGSMTYAGLLSFIYAEVDLDDPRLVAAVDWIRSHYTVEENPGMGKQGLYYNYCTMAKALNAIDENPFRLADGRTVNWRQELIEKLISLQRIEPETGLGYWINDEGRWWEADPVLATAYALFALEIAMTGHVSTAEM